MDRIAALPVEHPVPPVTGLELETTGLESDAAELARGLLAPQARISPKFFYDRLGSRLFEAITDLPEYYPTRMECALLQRHAASIAAASRPCTALVDLGAGNCEKAEMLLDALAPRQYIAVDVSSDFLDDALRALRRSRPELDARALSFDIASSWRLPVEVGRAGRLFTFFGSSIGNFEPQDAHLLLSRIHAECPLGGLLIGVDLVKSPAVLNAAYDDALGVTAAFNLNILNRANALLGADFGPRDWQHRAFFNPTRLRIEMHLEARRALTVRWPEGERHFQRGETLHTENSYKYRRDDFAAALGAAGFRDIRFWTDADDWFAVFHARH